MSQVDLPKPPTYDGDDPEMRRLHQWAEDHAEAVAAAIGELFSRAIMKGMPVDTPPVTVADLAAFRFRTAALGRLVFVTDEAGGAVPAFSDGTNFRRVTDRAVVS